MISGIGLVCVWVFDHDVAKEFYVDKLGCEVVSELQFDGVRWLSVCWPEQPELQLALNIPGPPLTDPQTTEEIKALVSKGMLSPGGFRTSDCVAAYEKLKANGVEFTDAPEERFYGIDAGFRDPFGNHWRLTQVTEGLPATGTFTLQS
jgi:catechol 2,3-dioxygenase-like lactoylglutathione lyase family enzyme